MTAKNQGDNEVGNSFNVNAKITNLSIITDIKWNNN
jgi:hypothetical protein